jgi:50S ribosomal protein L16 3-hydroxylase
MKRTIFGGLTHPEFMRQHWQKKPLVVRGALPDYEHAVTRDELIELAQRADVEARIVVRSGRRWRVRHGPFMHRDIARLPRSGWTLLVQGVDGICTRAARLLCEFAFIPYARFDDVMVSYAAPGGGVGPHFDSYDVFLVQGAGERRWSFSRPQDPTLIPGAPLRILQNFSAESEVTATAGDLVYLPPRWAHDGVAVGDCITYSIGFRAARAQELVVAFLEFLSDHTDVEGMYEDPDLEPTRNPGRIPAAMVERVAGMLDEVRWTKRDVALFLGSYLTEPKAHVVFSRPRAPRTAHAFRAAVRRKGVKLALPSRMLTCDTRVFMNGESQSCDPASFRFLTRLANQREIAPPCDGPAGAWRLLYDWYRAGYVELETP